MTVSTERKLRITRRYDASPKRVFDAWVDPAIASRWLFTSPTSEANHTELDARGGGNWSSPTGAMGWSTGPAAPIWRSTDHAAFFTFAMPQFSPNSDTITVEIEPDGDGCILILTQEGVDIAEELGTLPPETQSGSESGWGKMFDRLTEVVHQPNRGNGGGESVA